MSIKNCGLKKIINIFILLIIVFSFAGRSHSVEKIVFPNGFKLIYKNNPNNAIVAIDLFVNKGCAFENRRLSGLTNFMQILLTKGTINRSAEQIAREIESIGGILSTETTEDYSESYAVITEKYFSQALELLADICLHPTFPIPEIEKERPAILASLKSRQEDILTVTDDLFKQHFYGEHPYALPPIGTKETVERIEREDLINWHKKLYRPDQMTMVVVGNVSWNKVKKLTRKYFANLVNKTAINFVQPPELPPLAKSLIIQEKKKFEQAFLMIGYLSPAINRPDYLALKLLNTLLGRGMSSLLFQELREKNGLAYEVGSFYPSRIGASQFVIYIGLDVKNLTLAKEKILFLLNNLPQQLILEKAKIEAAKNFLRGDYLMDHQTNKRQAWYLGWWEILNLGFEYDEIYPQRITQVSLEDLHKVLKKYFSQNYLEVEIIPQK